MGRAWCGWKRRQRKECSWQSHSLYVPSHRGGSVTKQGTWQLQDKGTFLTKALSTDSKFGASGLHGLCFLGLILFKFIYSLRERKRCCSLSARISLQRVHLLISWGHWNQGPDSPGNSRCQSHPSCKGVFRPMIPKVWIFCWCCGDCKKHWHALSPSWKEASRTSSDSECSPWSEGAYAKQQPFWC